MSSNYTDYPHKETSVNLSGWTWHGDGPYDVEFSAWESGVEIAHSAATIYVDNGLPTWTPPSAPPPTASNPLAGDTFYVNPNSEAAGQAAAWTYSYPSGAALMRTLAAEPTATWFGNWNVDVESAVHTTVAAAAHASVPVLVAYNIPERDCNGFSAGGTNSSASYQSWINAFAAGIGSDKAVVILEPDALAEIGCLSLSEQTERLSLLSYAVATLKKNPGTTVYIDAGHAGWTDPSTMASLLTKANVASADGFSLNVSSYGPTNEEESYGATISGEIGNKHFVIDTSRNGGASDNGQWCNQPGSAIGVDPTTMTGNALVDAFLWVKIPGESDGYCNGGPAAGTWWPTGALQLLGTI